MKTPQAMRLWTAPALLLTAGLSRVIGDGGIGPWQELGPGNIGGRIRSIVVHPTNTKIMYVGSLGGGVWKTSNEGKSWFATGDQMGNMQVSTLVMDPADPNILYAGTGEGFARLGNRRDGKPGDGVFRTVDGGQTWQQLPGTTEWHLDANRFVNRVSVSPSEPQRLLVATDQGLYLSLDTGTNFSLQYTGRVVDVKFNPNNGLSAVAGRSPDGRSVPSSGQHNCAIYSSDGGVTWQPSTWSGRGGSTTLSSAVGAGAKLIKVVSARDYFNNDVLQIGADNDPSREFAQINDDLRCDGQVINLSEGLSRAHTNNTPVLLVNAQRTELAWAPNTPNTVYASIGSGGGTVWRSTDGGATFSFRGNPNGQGHLVECLTENYLDYLTTENTRRAFYNNMIWVAPNDPNLVIVGGLELLRSTDGGLNFTLITTRFDYHRGTSVHSDHHALAAHARFGVIGDANRATVFAGNDGGIQRTTSIRTITPSSSWSNIGSNALAITQLYAGAASRDGNYLLGASQDLDLLSRGAGLNSQGWFLYANAGDGYGCAIDDRSPNAPIFYRVGNGDLVRKSFDLGQTYEPFTNGLNLSEKLLRGKSYAFAMDPNNSSYLILGLEGVWRSINGATNWIRIRAPYAATNISCTAVAVAPGNSSRIWAGYDDGTMGHTMGGVTSWTSVAAPALPTRRVNSIAINPANSSEVLVAFTEPPNPTNLYDSVWFTDDGGVTWEPRFGAGAFQLPPHQVNTLVYHPTRANWVYAGTDVGVYASEDGGLRWTRTPLLDVHEGPANTSVQHLFWDGQNRLYAATYGRGLFRVRVYTSLYIDGAHAGSESGTLSQPFNTVREGLDVTGNGTAVYIEGGTYDEAGTVQFERRGDIRGRNGIVTIR